MDCKKCGKPVPEGQAFCSSCGQPTGAQKDEQPPPTHKAARVRWEYMSRNVSLERGGVLGAADADGFWYLKDKTTGKTNRERIAELGADGWELVSVVSSRFSGDYAYELLFVFKRPIIE